MLFPQWSIPPNLWRDRPAVILGGGPSLKGFDLSRIPERAAVVAVNNAYQLRPDADLLYWADPSWLTDHRERLPKTWRGGRCLTRGEPQVLEPPISICRILWDEHSALSTDPRAVAGHDSGSNAINAAWLAGADPIVLLGFEGRACGNWHNDHTTVTRPIAYSAYIAPSLERMGAELRRRGARVFNATPGTALMNYERREFGECFT